MEARRFEQVKARVAMSVLSLAADTRKAYFTALAAEETVRYMRQVKEAADASAELARRMEQVGNFNKLQRAREQSFYANAVLQLARAEQAQRSTRERLVRLLGVTEMTFEGEDPAAKKQFNFFPEHFYTELIIGLTLMLLLSALATLVPAEMGPRADPQITPEVIKPEWYFYVAFRWLKLFSGTTAMLSQGFIVFVMFFWPFIDAWLVRRFKYADISVWIGVVGALTIMGFTMWEALVAH
jgi:hypothetical protein